jgi:hypothetical protein
MKNITSIVVFVLFFASCNREIADVEIECRYQMYACGDCYPQYQVREVSNVSGELKTVLSGSDIYVVDIDGEDIMNGYSCPICYIISVSGTLKKRKGTYVLHAKKIKRQLIPSCCSVPD